MLISVKLLTKYGIISYVLGSYMKSSASERKTFQIKVTPKPRFPPGLGEKNGSVVPN